MVVIGCSVGASGEKRNLRKILTQKIVGTLGNVIGFAHHASVFTQEKTRVKLDMRFISLRTCRSFFTFRWFPVTGFCFVIRCLPSPAPYPPSSFFRIRSLNYLSTLNQRESWTPTRMTATLAGLISRLYSPPAVIELLITLAVHFSFHRWTSVYVPRRWVPTLRAGGGGINVFREMTWPPSTDTHTFPLSWRGDDIARVVSLVIFLLPCTTLCSCVYAIWLLFLCERHVENLGSGGQHWLGSMPGSRTKKPHLKYRYVVHSSLRPLWYTTMYLSSPPLPSKMIRYEPEVANFVKEHGSSLGLPRQPCTPEQAEWEDIAAKKRKQWAERTKKGDDRAFYDFFFIPLDPGKHKVIYRLFLFLRSCRTTTWRKKKVRSGLFRVPSPVGLPACYGRICA